MRTLLALVCALLPRAARTMSPSPVLVYALTPPEATVTDAEALAAAARFVGSRSVSLSTRVDSVVRVAAAAPHTIARDDRVGVTARIALSAGARRSYGDFGTPAAAALSLAHVDAWTRFAASGEPAAIFVVDPAATVGERDASDANARGEALATLLAPGAPAWDALILSHGPAPDATSAAAAAAMLVPRDEHLVRDGWRALPNALNGGAVSWRAYALTRHGVVTLLHEGGNAPLACRIEAHASALVELGLLEAIVWPPGAHDLELLPRDTNSRDSPHPTPRLFDTPPCDLCALPPDYSHSMHALAQGGPAAFLACILSSAALVLYARQQHRWGVKGGGAL